jgi:hypothetical protein
VLPITPGATRQRSAGNVLEAPPEKPRSTALPQTGTPGVTGMLPPVSDRQSPHRAAFGLPIAQRNLPSAESMRPRLPDLPSPAASMLLKLAQRRSADQNSGAEAVEQRQRFDMPPVRPRHPAAAVRARATGLLQAAVDGDELLDVTAFADMDPVAEVAQTVPGLVGRPPPARSMYSASVSSQHSLSPFALHAPSAHAAVERAAEPSAPVRSSLTAFLAGGVFMAACAIVGVYVHSHSGAPISTATANGATMPGTPNPRTEATPPPREPIPSERVAAAPSALALVERAVAGASPAIATACPAPEPRTQHPLTADSIAAKTAATMASTPRVTPPRLPAAAVPHLPPAPLETPKSEESGHPRASELML